MTNTQKWSPEELVNNKTLSLKRCVCVCGGGGGCGERAAGKHEHKRDYWLVVCGCLIFKVIVRLCCVCVLLLQQRRGVKIIHFSSQNHRCKVLAGGEVIATRYSEQQQQTLCSPRGLKISALGVHMIMMRRILLEVDR